MGRAGQGTGQGTGQTRGQALGQGAGQAGAGDRAGGRAVWKDKANQGRIVDAGMSKGRHAREGTACHKRT